MVCNKRPNYDRGRISSKCEGKSAIAEKPVNTYLFQESLWGDHLRINIKSAIPWNMKIYDALDPCFLNHPNAITAILYLMSNAYNLMQLFIFKRLGSKEVKKLKGKEIVKLLEKDLYSISYSREYFGYAVKLVRSESAHLC